MKKLLSLMLSVVAVSFAGSMMGLDALGKEDPVGATGAIAGHGYAGGAKTGDGYVMINPSNLAFEERVSFAVTGDYEVTQADAGKTYTNSTLNIPSFYLSFPIGDFGALALGISQHYSSNLDVESKDSVRAEHAHLEYAGSVFEFVPTYAIRLPFYRYISLGASMHIVAGSNERSLTLGPDNRKIDKNDAWATNKSEVTDIVKGDWETESVGYYTLSAMYRGRLASMFFSVTTPYTLVNNVSYDLRFSQTDTLERYDDKRKIKVPLTLATGIDYRLAQIHHVMLDFSIRGWDEDVENISGSWNIPEKTETQTEFMASIGYQRDGSKLFYDKYLKRMQYRAGAWYRNWYIRDVYEIGGSLGLGFPLGARGTMIDIAFLGGMRDKGSSSEWFENFFGIRATLMGVGSWGNKKPNYR